MSVMLKLLFKPFEDILVLKGRAGRMEYFVFYIACYLFISLPATLISGLAKTGNYIPFLFPVTFTVLGCITLVASCALTVRRLHDIGFSGWWFWLIFLLWPLVFVLFCAKGEEGANRFGPPPKSNE